MFVKGFMQVLILKGQNLLPLVLFDHRDPVRDYLLVLEDVWFVALLCINLETLVLAEVNVSLCDDQVMVG